MGGEEIREEGGGASVVRLAVSHLEVPASDIAQTASARAYAATGQGGVCKVRGCLGTDLSWQALHKSCVVGEASSRASHGP